MKKLATIIAASGLALGLSACGSPEKDAEQAVTDFAQAFEDKDYDKVCDSIDPRCSRPWSRPAPRASRA